MDIIEKVVARVGLAVDAAKAMLVPGEVGYAVDTKTAYFGDDTSDPPRVPTTKSQGDFEFPTISSIRYKEIHTFDGGHVDGANLRSMQINYGWLTHIGSGEFVQRVWDHSEDLVIENSDGLLDNPKISLSPEFKATLGKTIDFTYGPIFPENPKPGSLHYDDAAEILYIRLKQTENSTEFWLDISSGGGSGGGGNAGTHFYVQPTTPEVALIGDQWLDTETNRLFMRFKENDNIFWLEQRY